MRSRAAWADFVFEPIAPANLDVIRISEGSAPTSSTPGVVMICVTPAQEQTTSLASSRASVLDQPSSHEFNSIARVGAHIPFSSGVLRATSCLRTGRSTASR
jgi:hypothetical protein